MEGANRSAWIDLLVAGALAVVLTGVWTVRAWSDLSALRLPDSDDMMRLQQVRDWLSGQPFSDLTQYRLGASGVAMHWSRVADLVPAAIIGSLQGAVGRHQAELAAVIAWPGLLLAAAIALTGRIARMVAAADAAIPAMIVAAIAYPASTLFLPGRIDHHGLQLVLLLVTVLNLAQPPRIARGVVAGIASAASIAVGMEMAPLLAAAAIMLVTEWIAGANGAAKRMLGFGMGLGAATFAAAILFRTIAWDYPACDGFTAISARGTMLAALVPLVLGCLRGPSGARNRLVLAACAASGLLAALVISTPQCLSPYGGVDPRLQQLWLSRVAEAQGLLSAPLSVALGYAGLTVVGVVASAWFAWRTHARSWTLLLLLQLAAAGVMAVQLRGAYAGAMLAAPALGAAIVAARRKGTLAVAAAWAGSAGIFYPMAAQAMAEKGRQTPGASCTAPDLVAALGALPPGLVMAPIDTGAPAIAATRQQLLAGAYHRDGAADLAMYDFYRSTPYSALAIARRWHVRWVVSCDGFAGVPAPFAEQIQHGSVPDWLTPVAWVRSGGRIFEVRSMLANRAADKGRRPLR